MDSNNYIHALGMKVNMIQISEVIDRLEKWISRKEYGNYIVISNANDCILSKNNSVVREAVNNSSLSVPDGISMVLLARLYGYPLKKRVYGPDLMLKFLELAEVKGYTNFFYGATQETLNLMIRNIKHKFPRIKISGTYSPPFTKEIVPEDKKIIDMINKASPNVLWVGLGCPKQQLWMYKHRDKLNVPAMVGVGAAFDFLSGTKPQAPKWVRDNGFEWLFRLISEPRRLWKRYIVNGSIFIYYIGRQLLADLFFNNKLNSKMN